MFQGRQEAVEREEQFKICNKLGEGSQGVVYACIQLSTGRKYAVKKIITDTRKFKKEQGERKLLREIQNMESLFHHGIVNILTHVVEHNRCFLVMDLATGGDLLDALNKEVRACTGTFPGLGGNELASKYVTYQVVHALAYMHSKRIVHRDLKLDNTLIVRTRPYWDSKIFVHDIKITDFGLSKTIDEESPGLAKLKRRDSLVGTIGLISPETVAGKLKVSGAVDFWSFGVMLYMMLCGAFPFDDIGEKELQAAAMHGSHFERFEQKLSEVRCLKTWEDKSEEARSFVRNLLKVNPDERSTAIGCLNHQWLKPLESELEDFLNTGDDPGLPKRTSSRSLLGPISGVITEIRGTAGYAVDSVTFKLADGSDSFYGSTGGDFEKLWKLKEDELLWAVMQEDRDDFLGNGFLFQTSHGRVLSLMGLQAKPRRRFAASPGMEIIGLQFNDSDIIGIHVVERGEKGAVASISGRVGHAVDQIKLCLRNGKEIEYGSSGGLEQGTWELQEGERILAVDQVLRDAFLGHSVMFIMSSGRIIRLLGMQATTSQGYMVPQGKQICGLEFTDSTLTGVKICPSNGDLSRVETHAPSRGIRNGPMA
eukprot:TRINITY_DN15866_c0_g1_i1.p1 TRINITY_DN15866_c0_g1~~TRINITY_DN15866_c0_g1_i1.p1  ORF type:complete len:595 (-),score=91.39 TRINITY_DN15866_c0_g1_i1:87-1871(-)